MIREGRIREDIYYRLAVVQVIIPTLAERREDIPHLVRHFVEKYNDRFAKDIRGVSGEVMEFFWKYHWPGNVRQLKSAVESAMNFTPDGSEIGLADLPQYLFEDELNEGWYSSNFSVKDNGPELREAAMEVGKRAEVLSPCDELKEKLAAEEKNTILRALEEAKGNRTKAAESLGISKQLLHYRLKKYGLK